MVKILPWNGLNKVPLPMLLTWMMLLALLLSTIESWTPLAECILNSSHILSLLVTTCKLCIFPSLIYFPISLSLGWHDDLLWATLYNFWGSLTASRRRFLLRIQPPCREEAQESPWREAQAYPRWPNLSQITPAEATWNGNEPSPPSSVPFEGPWANEW